MFENNYDAKEFGARIRKLRKEKRMTQEELAKMLIITSESVSNIENGKTNCMPEHIVHICEIFDVSTDYLYFGTEKQPQVTTEYEELLSMLNDCNREDLNRVMQMVKLLLRK